MSHLLDQYESYTDGAPFLSGNELSAGGVGSGVVSSVHSMRMFRRALLLLLQY